MDDEDAEWLRGKSEFAPDEETERRFNSIADRIDGNEASLMARWDRIKELEDKLDEITARFRECKTALRYLECAAAIKAPTLEACIKMATKFLDNDPPLEPPK